MNGADGGSSSRYGYNGENDFVIMVDPREAPNDRHLHYERQIQKVPLLLRNNENNKGEYDPKVVSLGPYHHGKPELQFVEDLKPLMARLFVSDSNKNMYDYYMMVMSIVNDTRSCYIEGSTGAYTDEKFGEMMLLDGCFVLGIIESISGQKPCQKIKYDGVITHLGMFVWYSIIADMVFLLENQIPFQVLKLLMSSKFKDDEGMEMIDEFLEAPLTSSLKFQTRKDVKAINYMKKPLHLLQLFRLKLLLDSCGNEFNQSRHKLKPNGRIQNEKFRVRCSLNLKDYTQLFCSVTEHKAKGIQFMPTKSRSLNAIKFKSCCVYGRLEVRPFFVTPKTKIMISNMIAYEQFSNNPNYLEITSYVGFLKSLIDQPDDVKELRSKNILFSTLGSDQEVATVFKEVTTFGVEDLQIYEEVRRDIQDHYNSKAKIWMAEVLHNHFSSPWTVTAFIAATSVVILSFLQTYFTIFPRSRS